MSKIILHQWEISPYCTKVRKLLAFKGCSFEVVNYNGLRARKAAALSGVGKLPVLDHQGTMVQDSSRIARFLEQTYPQPSLYPQSEADRARAHLYEDWADESLYWYEVYFRFSYPRAFGLAVDHLCEGRPALEKWLFRLIVTPMYRKKLAAQGIGRQSAEQVEAEFGKHLVALNTLLGEHEFLLGDVPCIADIAVAAQLEEILRTSHLKDQILAHPNLARMLNAL